MKFNVKGSFFRHLSFQLGVQTGVGVIGVYNIGIHPESVNKNAIK
jgi:hypothetical protein